MNKLSNERLADAEWLEHAARYFEKRDTGGEDMAFWANVANAERCRSISQSLRAQGGARVKALEWHERVTGVKRAETIVGDYRVWTHHEADGVVFWQLSDGGVKAAGQGTEPECFAAAQADYERRILGALETSPAPVSEEMVDDDDRMQRIGEVIAYLQDIQSRFGETCVYIRRGGLSWGAVALNRRDDDKANGVFDLQAQHDRDMLARHEQIERLRQDNRELRAALATKGGQ